MRPPTARAAGAARARVAGLLGLLLAAWLVACGPAAAPPATGASKPAPAAPTSAPAAPAAPAASPAPAPVTVTVALPAQTAPVAVLTIAEREGFNARQGIVLETSLHQGGPPALQVMMAGAADLTIQVTGTVLNAIANGADIAIVAGNQGSLDHELWAKPEIASVAALEDKRVAAADPGSELNSITRYTLAHYGLPAERYDIVPVGATNARFGAMSQGAVDATLLSAPITFEAEARGYRRLGLAVEALPRYTYAILAAKRDWARQNADTLVRYLRAYQQTLRWIEDPANRERVVEHWAQIAGASPEAATKTYELYVTGVFKGKVLPQGGAADREGVQAAIDLITESGTLKRPLTPDDVLDASYLARASQP
jgi:NitT/TauT family transport system substrate-binding protein